MKKYALLLLLFSLLWISCEEIPPVINPVSEQGDCILADASEVAGQQRNVLIEEFTGVRCVNCPAGSQAIEALIDQYGDRLVAVSIHSGFFAQPYPDGQDFRTADGSQLQSFLDEPLGYPTAVVDRHLFPGEDDLQLGQSQWPGYVAERLQEPLLVRIHLATTYDPAERLLDVDVSLFLEEDIEAEEVHLSVGLTENNVVDRQQTPTGEDPNYVHKHVFRDMLTSFDGNLLTEELTAGAEICKSFQLTLDQNWVAENCKVYALVSLAGAQKDVLQVVEASVN